MRNEPFLPTLRELARCYQAFDANTAVHLRTLGLTSPQFDIIATLGGTEGMTSKELGEKTLITKGTLTGIVDRLVAKEWLLRKAHCSDGRCQIVRLTKKGERLFDKVFPAHLAYLAQVFKDFEAQDYARIESALRDLRGIFESGAGEA